MFSLTGYDDQAKMGRVRAVVVDPDDVYRTWQSYDVEAYSEESGTTVPLYSRYTPGMAVDPGPDGLLNTNDDSLLGVFVGPNDDMMRAITATACAVDGCTYFWLSDVETWRFVPGGPRRSLRRSNSKPALSVERLPSGIPKWRLWHNYGGNEYHRLESSIEDFGPAFSISVPVSSKERRFSLEPSLSLEWYKGKLRGAFRYGTQDSGGLLFFPVADGIFHAALKDVNDAQIIAQEMAESLAQCDARFFFHGMTDSQLSAIESANHVVIPRDYRICAKNSVPTSDDRSSEYRILKCFPTK